MTGRSKPTPESPEEQLKQLTPEFQYQFVGKLYGELGVRGVRPKGEIEAISAATITSNAVTDAVRIAVDRLHKEFGSKPIVPQEGR